MREILFRGKNVENGEWMFGLLDDVDHDADFTAILPRRNEQSKFSGCCWEVDPSTVGQYTGLTDKNGKRIFEGDVLRIARKMDGMGTYYSTAIECPVNVVVKWDMCAWMWETIAKDKRYIHFPDAWCHFECEVIGNIHDNQELVKEG